MNSKLHYHNKEISQDNLKAALEMLFRQIGTIPKNHKVKHITFSTVRDTMTVREWEAMKIVPIQIVTEEERMEVIKI